MGLFALALSLSSPSVEACDCGELPLSERVTLSDVILVGEVTSYRPLAEIRFRILERLKGNITGAELSVAMSGSDCDYFLPPIHPVAGQRFLIFGTTARVGTTTVSRCLGTGPLAEKTQELNTLRIPSTLTIEDALDVAKGCILARNVDVAGSAIESAQIERNTRANHGTFWRVTWRRSREIKGGQVFVTVFQDRTCEITYGE
jgi:hypothetical protein